jgi:polyhydroxyalkanoate synthesis repressor PhaR
MQRSKRPTKEPATVLIKKYPNRRLYNASSRKYVNLSDLAALIRQGQEIRVVDARTSEDLTRVVLTQIILEDTKEAPTGLPLELLRQLIMASGHAGREFIMWYLQSAFESLANAQNYLMQHPLFNTSNNLEELLQNRMNEVRATALAPLNLVKSLLTPPPDKKAEDELEQLRRRVAELEHSRKKPRARGKTARAGAGKKQKTADERG